MAQKTFNLPDPGEGLTEADLVTWRVAVGDVVKVNDMVVEVETAKSLVELPIPFAGTVIELLAAEGDTVEVGSPIIVVETGQGGGDPAPAPEPAAAEGEGDESSGPNLVGYGAKAGSTRRRARKGAEASTPSPVTSGASSPQESNPPAAMTGERARALAKPPVRKLAKDLGVDLGSVTPSGEGGIVTRADVEGAASGSDSQAREHERFIPEARGASLQGSEMRLSLIHI